MKKVKLIHYGECGYLFDTFGGYYEASYGSGSEKGLMLYEGCIVSTRGICNHYKGESK